MLDVKASVPSWKTKLQLKISEIEHHYPGRFGLYIKDLSTTEEYSHRGKESWYIASGVKVPVAIEVLRQVEQNHLSLDTRIRLSEDDYVDGAGETNYQKPGSFLSVQYLLEQMLIYSDNTASDLLIKAVGLDSINKLVQRLVPDGFGEITTLGDVRRHAYSGFHPQAFTLKNKAFIDLKAVAHEKKKIEKLAALLQVQKADLLHQSLKPAFDAYYSKTLNSATLGAYGELLETIVHGQALQPPMAKVLLGIMSRVQTGLRRIKAALPSNYVFAHKTGTQYARICDFGIIWDKTDPYSKRVVVASCVRDIPSLDESEKVMRLLGAAIESSGVMTTHLE